MSRKKDRDSGQFRIYTSDRSGFEYGFKPITSPPNAYTREAGKPVLDVGVNGASKVAPDEFDTPPLSKEPLGGNDISGSPRSNSDFATPSNVYLAQTKTIYYVNSSQSIRWNTNPVVYIAGSNTDQVMSVNPQFVPGNSNLLIAVECVGSSVTLKSGSGLTFDFSGIPNIVMNSGSVVTMIYNLTDSTWHVTSFNANGGF